MAQTAEIPESKKPSFLLFATEGSRAFTEYMVSVPFSKVYNPCEATADGHPILVLPGFMSTDKSTKVLRKFISKLGYNPLGWGLGRNYGKVEYLEELIELIDDLYIQYRTRISVIGWSLGGIYARQLAKERPDKVRQIITLGSPFRGLSKPSNALWLYNIVSGGKSVSQIDPDFLMSIESPAEIPTTAIYTKEDGIVKWEYCMEKMESEIHQNIRVRGSHFGLGHNPTVLHIIADRLKYNQLNWQQFQPKSNLRKLLFYPD